MKNYKPMTDTDFIILTYEDNEACPQSAIDFILKAKDKAIKSNFWKNWYNVYGTWFSW